MPVAALSDDGMTADNYMAKFKMLVGEPASMKWHGRHIHLRPPGVNSLQVYPKHHYHPAETIGRPSSKPGLIPRGVIELKRSICLSK